MGLTAWKMSLEVFFAGEGFPTVGAEHHGLAVLGTGSAARQLGGGLLLLRRVECGGGGDERSQAGMVNVV